MNPRLAIRRSNLAATFAGLLAVAGATAQPTPLGPGDYASIEARFRAAKNLETNEDFAGAAAEYRAILERYPTAVPRVYHNLGLVTYYQREYLKAIEAFESGLALDAGMSGSRLFLGIAYLNVERPEKALPYLEAAHSAQPSFESALALGQAYAGNLRYSQAIASFRYALPRAGSQTADVLHALGQAYLRLAERIVNEQAEAHPESKHTHLAAAKLFESQRVYQIAAIKYLEAAELDPLNASIFFPLARMLAILGLDVPSQLALERYWALLPAVPRAPIDRSLLPKEQVAEIGTKVDFKGILRALPPVSASQLPPLPILPGDINDAVERRLQGSRKAHWEAIIEAASAGQFKETLVALDALREPEALWLRDYVRASTHVWLDDYEQAALVAGEAALANEPSQAVQTLRAEIFRQLSLEYFARLIRDHPESCRARLVNAMNFAAQEKAEAEAEFRATIEACPLETQIRIELADYYLWNSRYAEARQACLDELAIHPHSSDARKRLGRIHVQLREADKALPHLLAAAQADAQDADVRRDLGRAYELLQRWDEAVDEYRLALDLDPSLNRVHYVLARIYFQLGQPDRAQEQFRLFKENEDRARQAQVARIQRLRAKEAPPASESGR